MAMNVDPGELVEAAAKLWRLVEQAHAGLPTGWVTPAGADLQSTVASAFHTAHAESAFNSLIGIANRAGPHAYQIGSSAVEYTLADDAGGRKIAGAGAETVTNPVPKMPPYGLRQAPPPPVGSAPAVDPLTFAQQLRAGPGPGPARAFASSIRQYLDGPHREAVAGFESLIPVMNNWTPVGTTVAQHLNNYGRQLSDIGSSMGTLAANVDDYANAFQAAKDRHPTPQEILATRKRLLTAMRSKDEVALAQALAEFNEQNGLSAQTHADYTGEISKTLPAPGGTGKPGDGTPGGTDGGSGGNKGSGQGDQSSTAMMSMLPSLLSSLTNSASSLSQNNSTDDPDAGLEYPDDYPSDQLPELPMFTGGGGSPGGGGDPGSPSVPDLTTYNVAPMPGVSATAALGNSGLPRAPVIDALPSQSAGNPAARAGSSPYMPYMPMGAGMGGPGGAGGGNDRNRVVAWHPDRLMYVDDTPHTDAVIGEKPTIAPTVTPPTPAHANQAPTNPGGSV
ncbi:PPE domain-containing protein [Nocardia sp. NPDC052001]|uniref:PPE domain-containing protein n=1 Tax=Nocardia sp. NPDC052001 TaxID=3154853 RepID=UPI00341318E3